MKIKNEDELDAYIICNKCQTLHKKIKIENDSNALCRECHTVLYAKDSKFINEGLSLSITGLIFFVLANFFPLIKIEILGHSQFITINKTIISLFHNGFYIVGMLMAFLIFIFPLMIFIIHFLLFSLFKLHFGEKMTKELLILLSTIKPWSMSEIFLVSILVSLVKLIGYASIDIGISFWGLIAFVLIDLYIIKRVKISQLWDTREEVYANRRK